MAFKILGNVEKPHRFKPKDNEHVCICKLCDHDMKCNSNFECGVHDAFISIFKEYLKKL